MKQPKKAKTTLFLTPPTENPEPMSKMFFFSVQTKRLHESFEGSYRSLTSFSGQLSRVITSYTSRQWETQAFSAFFDALSVKCDFWAITLVPEMLEGRARALSTREII